MIGARRPVLAMLLLGALAACGGDEPEVQTLPGEEVSTEGVRVTTVTLGNAIGNDRRVTSAAEEFRPTDTIYASVATEGSASGSTLMARWTYEDGQQVDETSQTISPTGPAVTEFHIARPDGFPTGRYQVEILLDGQSVETKSFEVR